MIGSEPGRGGAASPVERGHPAGGGDDARASPPHGHGVPDLEPPGVATVAVLPWGLLYEDFLDTIGVSMEAFCTEMTGGYLFNYVDALRLAGIRALIVLVSARVDRPTRTVHQPTGAPILMLPAPRAFLAVRGALANSRASRMLGRTPRLRALLDDVASYLATPPREMIRELRREGCGAILCQEYEYARFDACVLLGRWMRIPVFATFQGGTRTEGYLQPMVRPWSIRHAAGLIIGPRLEAERVRNQYRVPESGISRVFNPVDAAAMETTPRSRARQALRLPPNARVAVWYGRVERHNKGLDVLLDAWGWICRERPEVDLLLLMIGTGSDAEWMRERLQDPTLRGVRWRDEYIHDRSVLRLHLSAADVFAFPSRHEGFPVAPVEAMACGIPVVAADAPGVPDILEGGEESGGLIVQKGEAAPFAEALGRVLDDAGWSLELGRRARQRVERCFSLSGVGEQLRVFLLEHGLRPRPTAEVEHG